MPEPDSTSAALLADPDIKRQLSEIARILNAKPETRTPEAVKSLLEAGAAYALAKRGVLTLPPSPPEPTEITNARLYLDDFGEYVFGLTPAAIHLRWMAILKNPTITKVVIVAPPDHAKSQTVIEWLSQEIGLNPSVHIGLVSNTATQAYRKSVAIRDTVAHNPRYHQVFPQVQPDYGKGWAEGEWYVKHPEVGDPHSTLKAAGIRGPITGDRYDIMVFDDPDDLENTATKLQREKAHEWIEITAMRRLTRGGKAVAIMTRYHHEDSAAWFVAHGWTMIYMPAIAFDDNPENPTYGQEVALWEERWPLAELQKIRAESPFMFERVYQGNPTPQEGALVKDWWWQWYCPQGMDQSTAELIHAGAVPMPERFDRIVQVLDTASKEKEMNDPSVIATIGVFENNCYWLNVEEERMEYPTLKAKAQAQYALWRPNAVIIESASSGIALYQDLKKNSAMPVRDVVVDRDKVARLMGVLDFISSGRCYLPVNAPWVGRFVLQHSQFPETDHDDMVDTTSMGLAEIYGITKKNTRYGGAFLSLGQGMAETRKRVLEDMVAE